MGKEKLDNLSKIMVATGAINYMANQISMVNQQVIAVSIRTGIDYKPHESGIIEKEQVLNEVVIKLSEIMNLLGDCLNNTDIVQPIDERIIKEAFSVIVHGKDNID